MCRSMILTDFQRQPDPQTERPKEKTVKNSTN
jgi:hypothetical protein